MGEPANDRACGRFADQWMVHSLRERYDRIFRWVIVDERFRAGVTMKDAGLALDVACPMLMMVERIDLAATHSLGYHS
jgi:hypothetical protein